jgi:hypothetical protein
VSSDPALRRQYLKYNDNYFDGKLPFDLLVYWEPSSGQLAQTIELETADAADEIPELAIRIDPTLRFSQAMWKMTLLHEMCHVKLFPYMSHGAKFQREMLRLAGVGAFKGLW